MCTVEIRKFHNNGSSLEISLAGRLEKNEVKAVMDRILRQFRGEPGIKEVTVDIRSLEFIDTAGVALLILICRRIKSRDGIFRVINPEERILKVLRLAQIDTFISVEK